MTAGLPAQLSARLTHLLTLEPDWDNHGAPAISEAAVVLIETAVPAWIDQGFVPVDALAVPTTLGGVRLEWENQWEEWEIEVVPGEPILIEVLITIYGADVDFSCTCRSPEEVTAWLVENVRVQP